MQTSVALFIFNRPSLTARVFEAIASARPPRLLIVADGPRPDHPEDVRLVGEARALVSDVDWPCEVLTSYSDVNLGCGRRIASGLDWVFASTPEAIILEDDCLPHETFFPYCEQLLDRYREDKRVHMISGSHLVDWTGPYSYRFSRCFPVWGWATWSRAWKLYDYGMRDWPRLRETDWLRDHVPGDRVADLVRFWFDETYAGRIDQWDFQLTFSGWRANAVAAVPNVNLVTNIGHGGQATHQRHPDHPFAGLPMQPMRFPLRHPPEVEVSEEADEMVWYRLPRFSASSVPGPWDKLAGLAQLARRTLRRMS